jgi:hypothetical protein
MYVCPLSDPFTYIPYITFYPVELIRNRSFGLGHQGELMCDYCLFFQALSLMHDSSTI